MRFDPDYGWCYTTLGLQPGASLEKIKTRYQELAEIHYPDKVSPEQKDQGTQKFQEISQAKALLEQYWEQYGCAPPGAIQQPQLDEQQKQEAERSRQEEAEQAQTDRQRQEHERHAQEERQRQKAQDEIRARQLPVSEAQPLSSSERVMA